MPCKGRVALLCQHFYPEMISTGMHMTELATALTKLGWRLEVYCARPRLSIDFENPTAPKTAEYQGVYIVRVPAVGSHSGHPIRRGAFAATYVIRCAWRVLRHQQRFDGLLVTTNPPFVGLVAWLAAKLFAKPYILIVYDVYPDIAVKLGLVGARSLTTLAWERISRLIMNGAAMNVVIGRDMAEIVRGKLKVANQHKIHLIPNWSDEELVRPVPRERNAFRTEQGLGEFLIVQYSGRMGRTHNLEPLIDAAEALRDRKVIFQFIGDGANRRRLINLARERGLTNVQFLSYQPLNRLAEVLSAADVGIVCLGSAFTGLSVPSKTYGIMAAGRPILAFLDRKSEIGRTIIDNDCGFVLTNPMGSEVASVISQLLNDAKRLQAMGQNAYEAFINNYTLSHAARRYSNLMESVFL